jgi:hypothetical protein
MGKPDDYQGKAAAVLAAAQNLARERVRYAQEWQFARVKANSDMQATQMAIEATGDAITVAQAQLRALEAQL